MADPSELRAAVRALSDVANVLRSMGWRETLLRAAGAGEVTSIHAPRLNDLRRQLDKLESACLSVQLAESGLQAQEDMEEAESVDRAREAKGDEEMDKRGEMDRAEEWS